MASVNNLMSSGLSVGQMLGRRVGPEIHDTPGALCRRVPGLGKACLELSFGGSLGCVHTGVAAAGKEGRTQNLAVSSNRRYHRTGQVQSSAVQDQLGP